MKTLPRIIQIRMDLDKMEYSVFALTFKVEHFRNKVSASSLDHARLPSHIHIMFVASSLITVGLEL